MRSLNPGVKLAALIVASVALSVTFNTKVNLAVAAVSLVVTLATPRVNRRRLALSLVPFALTATALFVTGLLFGSSGADAAGASAGAGVQSSALGQQALFARDWESAGQLASRVLAYGGLGMLFAFTSDAFELVMSLMQQFGLPPKFAYGILAAYHFFPTVRDEYAQVGAALKVRGVHVGALSSRRVVPMLAHALERSESLAMAMESRGFEDGVPRRCAFRVPLRARDLVFAVGLNVAVIAALVLVR